MVKKLFYQSAYYRICAVLILCCVGTIIYSNTFNVPFQFDDNPSIINNPSIQNLTNLKEIWNFWPTRFITYFTIAINYHFHQLNVFAYHLFNLVVHLTSAIMVWWFILLTFSTPVMKDKKISQQAKLIALFGGLIFIAHPIQTESVTYIIQRTTSLATLFYLASLNLYIKSRLSEHLNIQRLYYRSSLVIAILAMFTKEMAITLPLMMLLYEHYFLKTIKGIDWKRIVPLLAMLLVIPLVMLLTKSVNFIELRLVSETGPAISPVHYFLTQFRVIVTYVKLLFLPLNQNLDYDYPITRSLLHIPTLANLLILILILIVAMRIFFKYRLISFAIFWFFLTLLPESSIIPIKDIIFEHRLYLPMVGFSLFTVNIAYSLFGKKSIKAMTLMLIMLVNWYAISTYSRNFDWKDTITLWNDTVLKSPRKARPYNNRGFAYQSKGDLNQAISDFNKAIKIDPHYRDAYINRGFAYQTKGDLNQAISDFNKAIEINPNDSVAYNNRAVVYKDKGNFNQAIADWNKAIQINSDYLEAYINRGNVYAMQGNFNQAFLDYEKAIQIKPKSASVYYNRSVAYFLKQEYSKSWEDIRKAESLGYKIDPKLVEDLKNKRRHSPQ